MKTFGIVHILVAGETAEHRLPQHGDRSCRSAHRRVIAFAVWLRGRMPALPDDLPDGQFFEFHVQPLSQKYFACPVGQISGTESGRPASIKGRFAIVTNVGREMRWTRRCYRRMAPTRTAKSCGPDAPTLASSLRKAFRRRRWQESPVTGESAG
jgi:hypothetical protein